MANSRFEYVKAYEHDPPLLPGCFIVVRVDGRGFTRFSDLHGFEKPNDARALDLMDAAAREVMEEFPDVRLAYGTSDEYSFVLGRGAALYDRRTSKIVSLFASRFTSAYVRGWPAAFGADAPLKAAPTFDARAVAYPDARTLRDYVAWRQADCHVNNQYNTPYWALVKAGATPTEAQATLAGTNAAFKNELLFSRFGINYNALPARFRKGTVLARATRGVVVKEAGGPDGQPVERARSFIDTLHEDVIGDGFWEARPELLA